MQITILRHGKPDFEWKRSIKGSDFIKIEKEYDSSGIIGIPPENTLDLVGKHKCIVCSDFPRSIQSAKALGAESICLSSPIFREMNPPYFDNLPFKMPLKYWVIVLRGLWFLGLSKNTESISTAKKRAKRASEKLIKLANQYDSVLFVGHGFLNHYIAKELLKSNWHGSKNPGKKYWEFGIYNYEE